LLRSNYNEMKVLNAIQAWKSSVYAGNYMTRKYVGDTITGTYIDAFSSLRLVVGTSKNYRPDAVSPGTTGMPPKFKIKDCILKIYK